MKSRALGFYVLATVVLLAGCQRDVSGTYLVSDKTGVFWLQLVRTPDNHLSGQFITSILKPDGSIDRNSASITGAINGENVTIVRNGLFGLDAVTVSGTFNGSSLTLTGVQSVAVTLKRATLMEYQTQEAALSAESRTVIAAKVAADAQMRRQAAIVADQQRAEEAEKDFEAQVEQLIGRMNRFDSEADIHLRRFPGAEKGYEAITTKINSYVTQERKFAGNPNTLAYRTQLVNAATQASFVTDQMHFQVQSLETSLQLNIAPLMNKVKTFEGGCHNYTPGREYPEPTLKDAQDHQSECAGLLALAPTFEQKYNATSTGLSHLEDVYKREKASQESLLEAAQKLE